jgi:hypothetical protein
MDPKGSEGMENQGFAGGSGVGRGISRKPWGRIPRIAFVVKINIYFLYIIGEAGVRGWRQEFRAKFRQAGLKGTIKALGAGP